MRLHHFTSTSHWPAIKGSGFLKVTESNISSSRDHPGPDVVWLTSDPDPATHKSPMLQFARLGPNREHIPLDRYKNEIRITVDIADGEAYWWPNWSRAQGITEKQYRALAITALPARANDWYVVVRPIPAEEWQEVVDTRTGKVLQAGIARGSQPPYPAIIFEDAENLIWFYRGEVIAIDRRNGKEANRQTVPNFAMGFEWVFDMLATFVTQGKSDASEKQALDKLALGFNWAHYRVCRDSGEPSSLPPRHGGDRAP